jgi:hypothetical protein
MTRPELLDTDPITLGDASHVVLRGIVSVSALRAEINRGNLVAFRIGKNTFTTPAAVREMMEKCRVKPSLPASISDPTTEPGSSATVDATSELASLKASVQMLKSGSLSTLRKSTSRGQRSAENLVQFPSQK